MRQRVLLLVSVLIAWGSAAGAQPNLVRNPGFEDATTDQGLPGDGWWLYQGRGEVEVRLDRSIAHRGGAAVRFHAKEETRCALVSAPFDVSPGDEIQFEGWTRYDQATPAAARSNFGLAFRDAGGRVFDRAYVQCAPASGEWTLVSGKATVPANAVRAELHLGYSAPPGTLWYDDVRAVITNPLSFALVEGAQPWTGPQTIAVRVLSRQGTPFHGTVRATVAKKTSEVAVTLEPAGSELVKVPIALGGIGTFDYQLALVDGGTVLRSITGKFRTSAPLVLLPAVPCYHVIGRGTGETRVDARILVNPAQRSGLRFTASLVDKTGSELTRATADASAESLAGVTLKVPVSSAGRFDIVALLVDSSGRELARATTDVRVRADGNADVALGADGFLRIGGQPHFPIGMYSAGRYDEMGRAGFSATHNYGVTTGEAADAVNPNDAHLKELLDRSWENGVRMMVELPRKAIEKAQWAQVRRRIETFRHHPGLLCWGSEERVARGEAPLANLAQLYRLVHELDPRHPFVLGDTRDVITKLQKDRRNFFPDECMDVGIWWWYPIPLHGPDGNGLDGRETNGGLLQPPSWLTTTLSRKPLWIAIQSYQQPRPDARYPTPAEYRCMAYLSIINGVKGLWFYTGSGQRDWQGKPAGLLNKLEESHWDYVQQLVRELRSLEPVLVAPSGKAEIKLAPADAPVEFTLRESGGALYLIAANKSERPQQVRFTGPALAGRKVEVLYEASAAQVEQGTLTGDFGPLGVHVYRLK